MGWVMGTLVRTGRTHPGPPLKMTCNRFFSEVWCAQSRTFAACQLLLELGHAGLSWVQGLVRVCC